MQWHRELVVLSKNLRVITVLLTFIPTLNQWPNAINCNYILYITLWNACSVSFHSISVQPNPSHHFSLENSSNWFLSREAISSKYCFQKDLSHQYGHITPLLQTLSLCLIAFNISPSGIGLYFLLQFHLGFFLLLFPQFTNTEHISFPIMWSYYRFSSAQWTVKVICKGR